MVLEGLDCRLSLQHKGRIIASQDPPPSPGFLRNGNENSNSGFTLTRYFRPSVESKTSAPQALATLPADERFEGLGATNRDVDGLQGTASPGKPTSLQTERWKTVQQAKLEGMSIRRMARELGIHRDTVRRYIDAESPPTRRSPVKPTDPPSNTITSPASDISAEHLNGHLSWTSTTDFGSNSSVRVAHFNSADYRSQLAYPEMPGRWRTPDTRCVGRPSGRSPSLLLQ